MMESQFDIDSSAGPIIDSMDEVDDFLYHNGGDFDNIPCTEMVVNIGMNEADRRFGFSVMGGTEEGFPPRVDDITPGSPADRADLEVGDEIIEVNGKSVSHASHAEVISYIHSCIQSRTIQLRVKRRLPEDLPPDLETVRQAYVIAVEPEAKERLGKLAALSQGQVQPLDLANMPALQSARPAAPASPASPEVNGIVNPAFVTAAEEAPPAPPLRNGNLPGLELGGKQRRPNGNGYHPQVNGHDPLGGLGSKGQLEAEESYSEMAVDCPPSLLAASGLKQQQQQVPPPSLPNNNLETVTAAGAEPGQDAAPAPLPAAAAPKPPLASSSRPPSMNSTLSNQSSRKSVGIEDLFSSLEHIRSKLDTHQDSDDIRFLHSLFHNSDFQHAVRVHNKVTQISSREAPPVPLALNLLQQVDQVRAQLTDVNSKEAEELKYLFSKPDFEAVCEAHDKAASTEAWMAPVSEGEDDSLASTSQAEDTVKIVRIDKTADPLGATIRNEGDSVIIGRIVKGGAAEKSGLLHEGDEILEINGQDVKGKSVNEVCDLMASLTGTLTFLLIPTRDVRQSLPKESFVHLRADFDYDPEEDPYIPCRELGLSFQKGDILHVINQEDPHWWQAYREGEDDQTLAGLVPSRTFQQQREAMKHSLADDPEPSKKKTLLCGKKNKKKKKKKVLYNADQTDDFDIDEILTYEEVSLYHPRQDRKRPIVLIGPPNVGRQELRQKLFEQDPQRFFPAIPHTSRTMKQGELNGKDYHFVSKKRFDQDKAAGHFVESGEFEKNLYGTSLEAIRAVVHDGGTCVLNLHPQSLKVLKSSDLMPYIVFVRPPSVERLRNLKAHAGELLTDEQLREIIAVGREMEEVYGHYFDFVLFNSDQERAFNNLLEEIDRIQAQEQWVPSTWIS